MQIYFFILRWRWYLKVILTEHKNPFILHIQYNVCWCPGNARSQGMSKHGIDLVILEYSGLSIRRVQCITKRAGHDLVTNLQASTWNNDGRDCDCIWHQQTAMRWVKVQNCKTLGMSHVLKNHHTIFPKLECNFNHRFLSMLSCPGRLSITYLILEPWWWFCRDIYSCGRWGYRWDLIARGLSRHWEHVPTPACLTGCCHCT